MIGARVRRTTSMVAWAMGWPARTLLLGLIRLYGATFAGILGGQCRFYPSCSLYAQDAIRGAGAVRGLALTTWRVLRCSPLSKGGVDHPPVRSRQYDGVVHSVARSRA